METFDLTEGQRYADEYRQRWKERTERYEARKQYERKQSIQAGALLKTIANDMTILQPVLLLQNKEYTEYVRDERGF